jgi:sugar transferase (PEP-CTERM/EpsH1 system associated)
MSEVLFLCHRIPFPPNKGDKIRSCRFLQALSERHRVHLGTFVDDPADWEHVDTVRKHCAETHFARLHPLAARVRALPALLNGGSLSVACYRNGPLGRWVDKLMAERPLQCVFVYSSAMAQFAMGSRRNVRRVIDFCDVDSAKWEQYATSKGWPQGAVYRREGRKLAEFEQHVAGEFDASIFISDAEARLFGTRAAGLARPPLVVRNGVDCEIFDPAAPLESPFGGARAIVFTGAMDYWANVDAVAWFARSVLPVVRRRDPSAEFWIVGSRPTRDVRALEALEGVRVTGSVPDTRPYLKHAAAVVAPLRIARGVQNKVLEALAMARPTVATSNVLQGFDRPSVPGVIVADEPEEMAQRVIELVASADAARTLGAEGRAFVLQEFSWRRNLDVLLQAVEGSA